MQAFVYAFWGTFGLVAALFTAFAILLVAWVILKIIAAALEALFS